MNWLKAFFSNVEETFEDIVADLQNTVSRLEARAKKRLEDVAAHTREVLHLQDKCSCAQNEADKSSAAAAKIKALFT